MQKNNPINSVYLIALAVASLILCVDSLVEAVIFAVVVVATFLISISIVSMIEKIADKHVRFLIFALLSAAIITALKVVCTYISNEVIVSSSEIIDLAIIPCLLLSIIPIYFEESYSVKEFFSFSLISSVVFALFLVIYGAIIEIAGFGVISHYSLGFSGMEFFRMPYAKFMLIACIAIIFNIIRRTYLKRTRSYRLLVEKYKIQIREIQNSAIREESLKEQGGDE